MISSNRSAIRTKAISRSLNASARPRHSSTQKAVSSRLIVDRATDEGTALRLMTVPAPFLLCRAVTEEMQRIGQLFRELAEAADGLRDQHHFADPTIEKGPGFGALRRFVVDPVEQGRAVNTRQQHALGIKIV